MVKTCMDKVKGLIWA